jgi:hypothetical protein
LKGASKPIIDYVDRGRLERIKRQSRSPVWRSWPERMAKKTGLTSVLKYVPKSRELAMSIAQTEISEAGLPQEIEIDAPVVIESPQIDEDSLATDDNPRGATPTRVKKEAVRNDSKQSDEIQDDMIHSDPSKLTEEELAELEAERAALEAESKNAIPTPWEESETGKKRGRKPKKDQDQGDLL